MCLGAMCINIGSHKGVFVTKKTSCIDEGIFTRCHEICGAAMAHIVVTNLAHACRFASSVCDGVNAAGALPENTLVWLESIGAGNSGSDPAVFIPSQTELAKQQACVRLAITICAIAAPPISWQRVNIPSSMQLVFLVTKTPL